MFSEIGAKTRDGEKLTSRSKDPPLPLSSSGFPGDSSLRVVTQRFSFAISGDPSPISAVSWRFATAAAAARLLGRTDLRLALSESGRFSNGSCSLTNVSVGEERSGEGSGEWGVGSGERKKVRKHTSASLQTKYSCKKC